jgi:hypothetical protein
MGVGMKIRLYFYQEQYSWELTPRINVFTQPTDLNDVETISRIFIMEYEVDVPDLDFLPVDTVRKNLVAVLCEKKKEIKAETHMKLSEIEDKIQQLLCIEMK